jgi:hypothetical protein
MAKDMTEFAEIIRRLPKPIACFGNGAACPWCGDLHVTVTFGQNLCKDCGRPFLFGYPHWAEKDEPLSWVDYPFRELDALGERASLLPKWEMNDRLKQLHFQKVEEKFGEARTDVEN